MGDPNLQNDVPDPLLSGKELPTFKFELEKSKGKVLGNGFGREVTVEQFPISKGIAAVSMRLEPDVMHELHWHATAADVLPTDFNKFESLIHTAAKRRGHFAR